MKWGQDAEYLELFTLMSHYEIFCSTVRAIDQMNHSSEKADKNIYNICSKVFIILSL